MIPDDIFSVIIKNYLPSLEEIRQKRIKNK